ncbi:MAG: hypothetical protein IKV35_02590, partial [Clostridia bacterium]|nr:hypothetical protein [Clostridia bacterium]
LAVVTPLLLPLWRTFERTAAAVDGAAGFSLAFAPVYAAILTASGSTATAASYQTIMLAAAEGISVVIGRVVLPLTASAFALGAGGAVDGGSRLAEVGGVFHRVAVWLIGVSLTIFVGMLSLQSVLASAADSVSGRVLRFSVAGFVPIVGGHLAEALYTVRGCLSALKGSVG